jgi:hypothetical protein
MVTAQMLPVLSSRLPLQRSSAILAWLYVLRRLLSRG